MIKVSIIMPFFNGIDYIDEAVQSVLAQTLSEIELIMVDDGSSDGSEKRADEFAALDSRVKVIHQKNCGVSAARNAALDIAVGRYIGFVDADDWILPKMYETLFAKAETNNVDIVTGGYFSIDGKTREKRSETASPYVTTKVSNRDDIKEYAVYMNKRRSFMFIWRSMFKRSLITEHNIRFDTNLRIGEDTLFAMNCFLRAEKVIGAEEKLYVYRWNDNSAMRKKYKPSFTHDIIYQYDEKYKLCMNFFPERRDEFFVDSADYFFKGLWCNLFSNIYLNDISDQKQQLRALGKSQMLHDLFRSFDINTIRTKSVDWYALVLIKRGLILPAHLLAKFLLKK